MQIRIAPPARMVLEQLSAEDRRRVQAALRRLTRNPEGGVTAIRAGTQRGRPYFMAPASEDLRILFECSDGVIEVIDIATHSQLAFFQRATA